MSEHDETRGRGRGDEHGDQAVTQLMRELAEATNGLRAAGREVAKHSKRLAEIEADLGKHGITGLTIELDPHTQAARASWWEGQQKRPRLAEAS
jgi:hypothetical protein